ncbi:MAG TPA: N-formylglutamate amidohydrolase [Acetobacteraceae bacterium]
MDLPLLDPFVDGSPPPALVARPVALTAPIVFASPHSGRAYPPAFVAAARLDPLRLRRSEDSFVEELFAAAPAQGMPLVMATFPRAYCDANREPWELDPNMFEEALPPWVNTSSPRVGAGLGTIAKVVASGETIYRGKLRFSEARERVDGCWHPFHEALKAEIATAQEVFGACLLIDCHSMPANSLPARSGVDVVLGDAHGTSCGSRAVRLVEQILAGLGYSVRRNDPYAGGYITRHYGRPRDGVHALQIEINRGLYMDESTIERLEGFGRVQDSMSQLMATLAEHAAELHLS